MPLERKETISSAVPKCPALQLPLAVYAVYILDYHACIRARHRFQTILNE